MLMARPTLQPRNLILGASEEGVKRRGNGEFAWQPLTFSGELENVMADYGYIYPQL